MESAVRGFTRHRITVPHAGRRKGWTVDLIGGQVGGTVDAVKAGITTNAAMRLAELAEVGLTDVLALYEVQGRRDADVMENAWKRVIASLPHLSFTKEEWTAAYGSWEGSRSGFTEAIKWAPEAATAIRALHSAAAKYEHRYGFIDVHATAAA